MTGAGFILGCGNESNRMEDEYYFPPDSLQVPDAAAPAEVTHPGDASEAADAPRITDMVEAIEARVDSLVDFFVDSFMPDEKAEVVTQPSAPTPELFADMPCGYPASLAFDEQNMTFYTTCGMPNTLFRCENSNSGWNWEAVGEVAGYPSNHIMLPGGYHAIPHSMPDGFTILDGATGNSTSAVDFSADEIYDEYGGELDFVPNNPTGAATAGGYLCFAASNIDTFDMDPAKTTFFPGTFICFEYSGDGITADSPIAFYTSGKNPTGVALLDAEAAEDGSQRVAVLSSNTYAPSADSNAFVDVFTAPQMTKESFKIETPYGEPVTAQISPVIAMTSGGTLLIGLQKPAASLLGLDPETGETEFYHELPQIQNFISSIDSLDDIVAVSDFGVFGAGGRVVFLNLSENSWKVPVETPIAGSLGPSTMAGGNLFQTSTSDDMAGKLWRLGLQNFFL